MIKKEICFFFKSVLNHSLSPNEHIRALKRLLTRFYQAFWIDPTSKKSDHRAKLPEIHFFQIFVVSMYVDKTTLERVLSVKTGLQLVGNGLAQLLQIF